MSQHIAVPSIGKILYGSVTALLNFRATFSDTGIAAGVLQANLSVLDTKHPLLLEFFAHVVTAFNATTSNSISVGSTPNGSEFLLASDITAGTIGFYPAANANKKYVVSANTPIYIRASGNFATGTITSTNTAPADGATVSIGGQVYTFKTTLTASTTANQVLINTTADAALLNLIRAINGTGTPGTDYGSLTPVNASVIAAAAVTSHAFAVTAIVGGTGGNAIATPAPSTSPASHMTWGATTLTGGTDPTAGDVHVYCRMTELFPDPTSVLPVI